MGFYMPYSTITSKGQITIPKSIRNNLNLKTGDVLAFKIEDGEIKIMPVRNPIEEAYGILSSKRQKRISIHKMNEKMKKTIGSKNR